MKNTTTSGRIQFLKTVADHGTLNQKEVAKLLNVDESYVSRVARKLDEEKMIKRKPEGNKKILQVTRYGFEVLYRDLSADDYKVNSNITLHNFVMKYKIDRDEGVPRNWRERLVSKVHETVEDIEKDDTNGSVIIYQEEVQFRVTRDHLFVRLGKMYGTDPDNLKERAIKKADEEIDWIAKKISGEVKLWSTEPKEVKCNIWVNEQHLAIIRDPFSELVKENTDLSELKIYDQSGENLLLWIDDSEGEAHLESGNPPGRNDLAEDDIQFIKDFYIWMLNNKEAVEKLKKLGKRKIGEQGSQK